MAKRKDDSKLGVVPATAVEWGARIISALGLVTLFGFLFYGAAQPHVGPNFEYEIKRDQIEQRRNGWAVPVSITNRGTIAVGEVNFELRKKGASGTEFDVKRGRLAIFGAGETIDTEVWFDTDPRDAILEFRVDTYQL